MVRMIVSGCLGRMGSRTTALASKDEDIELVGGLEVSDHPSIGKDLGELLGLGKLGVCVSKDLDGIIDKADVVVEFTTPEATTSHVKIARAHQRAMVIGTTGLTVAQGSEVKEASKSISIVMAPNMSVGVNLLFGLVGEVAKTLGEEYNVEIVEAHHKFKKDAPSGTAKKLADLIADARDKKMDEIGVYGRKGQVGTRKKEEIGIHAVRAGDIVGEHTVIFGTEGERIELTHKAHSRDTFGLGALRASKFVVGKKPGLYDMQDVLKGE